MTKLDEALILGSQDPKAQPLYYDLFLNSLFFIPVIEEEGKNAEKDGVLPLLVEANEKQYLMLFDTIQRLIDWAEEGVKYATLPGHAVAEMSLPQIYWALNYDTEHPKMFAPDEIAWLQDVVRQAKEEKQPDAAGEVASKEG